MSKEPTRHQLSSRLAYNAKTPAFLLKLQQRIEGTGGEDDDDEFEDDGSGRPPIPRRPAIPERPEDDAGSADEDDGDELPQVVVLKEGKHLTEREAENEKRKAKGLPPLPDPAIADKDGPSSSNEQAGKTRKPEPQIQGLSFSSKDGMKAKSGKRKAIGDARDEPSGEKKSTKKKAKKPEKKLLSFGDDA